MKKIILYSTIVIAIITVIVLLVVQSLGQSGNKTTVSFTLPQDNIKVTIYQETNQTTGESKQIDSFSSTKTIDLPTGKYYYLAEGDRFETSTVKFSVPDETSFTVKPDYDIRYLSSLLETEVPKIDQLIEMNYAKITNGYKINPGKFYKQGQWYATIISDLRSTNDDPYDEHRIVLTKQNGSWVAVTTPEITLSAITYPEIPREILSDINRATVESLAAWGNTNSFNND